MTLITVLLVILVLLLVFSVYIIGVISSKTDLIVYYLKMIGLKNDREENDSMQKQFMGMMNYTADDWRDADE